MKMNFTMETRLTEMKALYIASIINPKIFNLLPFYLIKRWFFDPGSYGQYLEESTIKDFQNDTPLEYMVGKSLINNEIFVKIKIEDLKLSENA